MTASTRPGSLLPIYIGDDLTDEDAFEAVKFDGIGIVVGHDEDGDRKTAAHFTLQSPDQVREFLQRGSRWLAYKHRCRARHGITSSTDTIRRARSFVRRCARWETATSPPGAPRRSRRPGRCTTRAPMPPGSTTGSSTTCRAPQIDNESLVNLPNWLALTFRIDGGSWFDIDAVTVLSYRQTLDLRGAVLTREVRFSDDAGRTTSLTQRRFVAMHMAHVGALETTIVAEDWSGTIEIRSTLDGNVTNSLVERYRDLASQHLGSVETREISDNSVLLTVADDPISHSHRHGGAQHRLARRGARTRYLSPVRRGSRNRSRHRRATVGRRGGDGREDRDRLHGPRCRDVRTRLSTPSAWLGRLGRFAELLDGHLTDWVHLWERLSIEFDDFTDELRILRLHLLHLLQTVSPNTVRPRCRGAGARTAR